MIDILPGAMKRNKNQQFELVPSTLLGIAAKKAKDLEQYAAKFIEGLSDKWSKFIVNNAATTNNLNENNNEDEIQIQQIQQIQQIRRNKKQ